ncbi:hypothetical protein Cs7R123_78620 [Catellatospora sp. TT07R-123]|uniref:hypothetical protein n=1 Tax=Catellatospora sp. TT07R-123 TaxID=2733863 RepID=UPI001B05C9DA|nr:hypothetical protein [Catellatospora sp. TT07R-123]GHJ50520.1 hypothetical protein Cs7R123_78620 [Catellatospora sp. TT07R-123]
MRNSAKAVRIVTLAVAALIAGVVCLPFRHELVPVEPGSVNYHYLTTWGEIALPFVLAVLAVAGGWWLRTLGGAAWTAVAISLPPLVLYAFLGEFRYESMGADLWMLGTMMLSPFVLFGAMLFALAGFGLRRWTDRPRTA